MTTYRQVHRIIRDKRGKIIDRIVLRPRGHNLLSEAEYDYVVKRAKEKGHEIETRVFNNAEKKFFKAFRVVRTQGKRRAFRIKPADQDVFGATMLDYVEKRARKNGHEVVYATATDPSKPKPNKPVMVGRTAWGAKPPKARSTTEWTSTTPVRVHHTVARIDSEKREDEIAFMQQIQNGHMAQGWADIGYNYIIMPSGRVYVARGQNVVGAHTVGHNEDIGICFAGDFRYDKLTTEAIRAFHALRAELKNKGRMYAHSSTYPTECPGPNIREALKI